MKDFWEGLKNFLASLKDSSKVDIYVGFIRGIVYGVGGLAIGLGWISPEHESALVANLMAAIGPMMLTAGFIWSVVSNSAFSIRKAAAKLPENQHVG